MAKSKKPSVCRKPTQHPRGLTSLASAFLEWLLMLLLFGHAAFSYVIARFARYCNLPLPCLLSSRLDNILGKQKVEYFQDLFCKNHKSEISSLVLCHAHCKLVDVHEMCETCLFSFATINKSNSETYRLLVGKLGDDPECEFEEGPLNDDKNCVKRMTRCCCCNELWCPKSYPHDLLRTCSIDREVSHLDTQFDMSFDSLIDSEKLNEEKMERYAAATKHDRLLLPNLQPGDHIAATRKNGIYEHHGIYEGKDRGFHSVIHFQGPIKSLVKGAAASMFCTSKCGYHRPKKGGIVISCLDCFSLGQKILKFQYMTNRGFVSDRDPNWHQLKPGKLIPGYCTKNKKKYYLEYFLDGKLYGHSRVPKEKCHNYRLEDQVRFYELISERTSEEVLDKASESKLKPYSLGGNNCEHFVVHCKTGLRISIQVQNLHLPIL